MDALTPYVHEARFKGEIRRFMDAVFEHRQHVSSGVYLDLSRLASRASTMVEVDVRGILEAEDDEDVVMTPRLWRHERRHCMALVRYVLQNMPECEELCSTPSVQ